MSSSSRAECRSRVPVATARASASLNRRSNSIGRAMGPAQRAIGARAGMGALLAGYAAFGAFWGTWVVVFAEFLRRNSLSAGQASLLFTASAVVAIVVMTFGAPLLDPLPRHVTVALALAAGAIGGALVAVLPREALLVGFVVLGAGTGLRGGFLDAGRPSRQGRVAGPVLPGGSRP